MLSHFKLFKTLLFVSEILHNANCFPGKLGPNCSYLCATKHLIRQQRKFMIMNKIIHD